MLNPALEPRHNWRILLQLRALAVVGQSTAVLLLYLFFDSNSNVPLMGAIIAIYAMINGILWVQLRNPELPGPRSYFFQLMLDVIELSILFYITGGAGNPFISYLLVPISIASIVLPLRYVLALTACCILVFSFLSFFFIPLPEFSGTHRSIKISQIALWCNFVMSSLFISLFVTHMINYMRRQQNWLADSREHLLQDEQILAIATHAAGTAHELGTPLNSMKLLVEELLIETESNALLNEDMQQLKTQINLCSGILSKLSEEARINSQWHNEATDAVAYLEKVLDKWRLLRPEVTMTLKPQVGQAPIIRIDPTLNQALINLLNNAADANSQDITIEYSWNDLKFTIKIFDKGAGISKAVLERLGQELTTTKDGMGIGFFLSNASLARRGGTVALYPVEEGGTLTEITIPVEANINKAESNE